MISNKTKVLLVDDHDLMRRMLRKNLQLMGFTQIDEAEDGAQAIKLIAESFQCNKGYGLVLLDWNMPKKTGMEVLEWCRRNPSFDNMFIIMVTAESEKTMVLKALSVGANDYIVKPCSPDTMKEKIKYLNDMKSKEAM